MSKGSDQTVCMRRLILGFAGCTYHIVGNIMWRLNYVHVLFRFIKHYEGRRAPFVIIVNPVLVQKPDLLDGIIEFVEYAIGAFPVSSFIVVQISLST